MSVRRLADDSVQPQGFAFDRNFTAQAKTWVKKYPKGREQSAVIPLLMLAQEQEGWVTKAAIEHVADMLRMPYIRALEVATFYTQFQLKPVGTRAHIQVCGTTPCMLRGSEELMDVCRKKINPEPFKTNEEGTLSWEEVECQGACVNAPMVIIFKDAYEDLTPERLAEIIDEFEAGKGADVPTGPQNGRTFSAPISGQVTLTEDPSVKKNSKATAKGKAAAAKKGPEADEPGHPKSGAEGALGTSRPVAPGNAKNDKAAAREKGTAAVPADAGSRPAKAAAGASKTGAAPLLDDKNRPAAVEKPASPDDLKLISGVGPALERKLNDLGIYTYKQVASWKKAEREWVDGYLSFKGRIDRDDWVRQAKALAKGGRDEYVRVFGKEPR
ncbi:NADH-quinone oxidoreductase subunit E [Pseudohoeflea suaedae]|uniref:NADH-quinone oxidoreductase subunit E n=1 Tax=Pseudohoeflea suaedae TaxID=877384 RepID=A0A4V3A7K2_9HYPH|nr:NADH-quinone oxidoreductase subunit E [Pseudohoeflea suaedae]TDH39095.1 NADH-quinone oxidoreductase subunit E [Pseudohoeflea suaedae]